MIFFEHETKYINQRLSKRIVRFNGKWLVNQDNQFIYAENPFEAIQIIKFVK